MISKKQPETILKEKVLRDLHKIQPSFTLKTQERTIKGIPDIIWIYKGRAVAFELKDDNEDLEPIQAVRLKEIERAGAIAMKVCPYSWGGIYEAIKAIASRW